ARRRVLLERAQLGHGEDPRVHDALDGAPAALLPRRAAADRRRALRRSQGLGVPNETKHGGIPLVTPSTEFPNPVLPGLPPAPSVCRVGRDFYLACSSFEYSPGAPISHSRDLVSWRPLGHALTRGSQLDLTGVPSSGGMYAPTLRHHDGTFFLVTTLVG